VLRQSTHARQEAAAKQEELQRLSNELSTKSYQAERLRTMLEAAGVGGAEGADDMNASLVELMRPPAAAAAGSRHAAAAPLHHQYPRAVSQHAPLRMAGEMDVELDGAGAHDESMVAGGALFFTSPAAPTGRHQPLQQVAMTTTTMAGALGGAGVRTRMRTSMSAARASLLPAASVAAAPLAVEASAGGKASRAPLGTRGAAGAPSSVHAAAHGF